MGNRDGLVRALEQVIGLLESRTSDVSGTVYVSPQQPIADISQPLWHIRRDHFVQLRFLALLFQDGGPLPRIAQANAWQNEFALAREAFSTAFSALNCIRYHHSETPVALGDHVQHRGLLSKHSGRVTYVPGVSPQNREIDFGGLVNIGIHCTNGTFMACYVEPDSLEVIKRVAFRERDPSPVPNVPADEVLRE